MSRKKPSETTVKKLFALSGNRCAFPNCNQLMVDDDSLIGEVCHIEAANPGGERYNENQTDQERCAFENLILLCANHHRLTNNVKKFPVEVLKKMKEDHEANLTGEQFQVSDRIIAEALATVVYCDSFSVSANSANISIYNSSSEGALPCIEPDFDNIHLGNQFLPPFVVLTLNFHLPLVNTSSVKAKDWAVHISAPHMEVDSTDKKFEKTIPADHEIMLHSTETLFPNQKTKLWFSLSVKVNYELEAENRFKKLLFDPIGLGIVEELPIVLTIYCENTTPTSHEYTVKSETYFKRLNDYYIRKKERESQRSDPAASLLRHINNKYKMDSYLTGQGTEDAHKEVSNLLNQVAVSVNSLKSEATGLDIDVGGNERHLVARRSGNGACAVEIEFKQTYRNKFDDARLEVGFWKGLRQMPGRSEVIFETPVSGPARKLKSESWSLHCGEPSKWQWKGKGQSTCCLTKDLAEHLYSEFVELVKAEYDD